MDIQLINLKTTNNRYLISSMKSALINLL